MPEHAIATCLQLAGAKPEQVDAVAVVRPIPGLGLSPEAARPVSRTAASSWWSITWRTPRPPTILRRSKRPPCSRSIAAAISAAARAGRRAARNCRSSTNSILPIPSAISTAASPNCSASKPTSTSTRCSGSRSAATTASKTCSWRFSTSPKPVRASTAVSSARSASTHGGFGARFFERLGLADGAAIPEELRAHVAAGLQHAVEDAVIRMAGEGRKSLPGRRAGLECAAGLRAGESLRLSRTSSCSPWPATRAPPIGAVLEAWHGVYRQTQRVAMNTLEPRPRLRRRRKSSRCWKTANCASTTW